MKLYLYEELLLLALREDKGTVPSGTWYQQAIGGAVLAELLLEQRLAIDSDEKHVLLKRGEPLGESLIDACLELVVQAEAPRTLESWLGTFAAEPKLLARAAASLCERGILSEHKSRFLWIFETCSYPELNHEPERLLVERLERAVSDESSDPDPRTVTVISLADKTGLLKLVFDKATLRDNRERIDAIIAGERVGQVAEKVIESISAAIMISTMVVPVISS